MNRTPQCAYKHNITICCSIVPHGILLVALWHQDCVAFLRHLSSKEELPDSHLELSQVV